MSHSATRVVSVTRSGVLPTRRYTWDTESTTPRSASSGTRSGAFHTPCAAITSRNRQV